MHEARAGSLFRNTSPSPDSTAHPRFALWGVWLWKIEDPEDKLKPIFCGHRYLIFTLYWVFPGCLAREVPHIGLEVTHTLAWRAWAFSQRFYFPLSPDRWDPRHALWSRMQACHSSTFKVFAFLAKHSYGSAPHCPCPFCLEHPSESCPCVSGSKAPSQKLSLWKMHLPGLVISWLPQHFLQIPGEFILFLVIFGSSLHCQSLVHPSIACLCNALFRDQMLAPSCWPKNGWGAHFC